MRSSPLFSYLRDQHVVPVAQPMVPTRRDELLARYRCPLIEDRGRTPSTVLRYERFARRFLAGRAARTGGQIGVEGLCSAEVSAWMLEVSSRLAVESAKREAADLRALLRFLYLDGVLGADLGSAMPPVAVWRGARLPQAMSAARFWLISRLGEERPRVGATRSSQLSLDLRRDREPRLGRAGRPAVEVLPDVVVDLGRCGRRHTQKVRFVGVSRRTAVRPCHVPEPGPRLLGWFWDFGPLAVQTAPRP